jgi:hypothetical protein
MKWLVRKPEPTLEVALSETIRKRAEEQNAIIERKKDEIADVNVTPAKIVEKDFFE